LAKDLRALLALDLQGGEDPSAVTSPLPPQKSKSRAEVPSKNKVPFWPGP